MSERRRIWATVFLGYAAGRLALRMLFRDGLQMNVDLASHFLLVPLVQIAALESLRMVVSRRGRTDR
jgi:hypothetical protein